MYVGVLFELLANVTTYRVGAIYNNMDLGIRPYLYVLGSLAIKSD